MAEDEVKLRLAAETVGYKKAWADVRVQTARDLAQIKSTVTNSLNQTRVGAAQSLAGIRQAAATNLAQTRVNTAAQLAQIRVNTTQQLQAIRQTASQSLNAVGSQFENAGRRLTVGLTLPLAALAAAAVKSARDIDAQVNTLRAFTGSAEAAENRLSRLIATALKTPGLTTGLALDLDTQLRPLKVAEAAIDKILPVIGRLNAVKRIEDPQRFTENLVQLITTDFQKRDLRELVRASPLAGQIIAELFNVNSPTNAEAIRAAAKRMGITSVDAFFSAMADAASRNEGLQRLTESIGTRFDKLRDRVTIALRPLGLAIIDALTPAVDAAVPLIEGLGKAFASLPDSLKLAVVGVGGFAAVLGPALLIVGSLISTVGRIIPLLATLNAAGLLPTISNLRLLFQVMTGTASLAAGSAATTAVMAAGWIALAAALAVAGFAIYKYFTAEKQLVQVSAEQVRATSAQVKGYQEQIGFLDGLKTGVARTTAEQDRLKQIYASLTPEARARIGSITDETGRLSALRAELQRLLDLKGREREQQAATLAGTLATNLAENQSNEQRIAALREQIDAYTALAEVYRGNGAALTDQQRALAAVAAEGSETGLSLAEVEANIRALNKEAGTLRNTADGLNGTIKEQSDTLKALGADTDEGVRRILLIAKSMSLFKGDVDVAVAAIVKFRLSQGDAGAATSQTTGAVDEQVESLKRLKRALAEAEIEARSRAEATKRAFEEGRTSDAQYTRERIANARQREAASLKEIDAFIEAKRKELETATDDKTKKTTQDEIEQEQLKRKDVIAKAADEVANLLSEQRIKERDDSERHNDALLSLTRTNAETRISILRDAAVKNEALRLTNERKIVEIEQGVTQAELTELFRRRNNAVEGTAARVQIEEELNQKLAERRQKGIEQRKRIDEAELASRLRPIQNRAADADVSDSGDQGLIERQRASLERSGRAVLPVLNNITKEIQYVTITSFENLEKAIKQITDEGYARRIQLLQDEINVRRSFGQNVEQLEAQKARLEQERVNAREQGDRTVIEGAEKDIDVRERQIRQVERLTALERTLASVRLSVREAVLKATRTVFGNETKLINQRYDIEAERLKLALDAQLDQLDEEERADIEAARQTLKNKEDFEKAKLEIEAKYRALRKAAEGEAQAQDEGNEQERQRQLELQDPSSPRSLLGDDYIDALNEGMTKWQAFNVTLQGIFAELSARAGNMRSIMLNAIGGIGDALTQSISNWILYGGSIGKAMKQAAAAVISGIAVQAGIKAIYELAEGWAAAANPFTAWQAPMHFAAAKLYGLVSAGALAAGVGLRGVLSVGGTGAAGNLADNGASAASGSASTTERDRTISEGRTGGAPNPNEPQGVVGHVVLEHRYPDGHTETQIVRLFRSNGPLRSTLRSDLLGEAPSY